MRADLIGKFIEKLNSFISDCEKIIQDDYLIKNIDGIQTCCGRISIYLDCCYLYIGHKRIKISWDCDNIWLSPRVIKGGIKGGIEEVILRRNEFDPIILCLEQPNLRKIDTEILLSILKLFDTISDKIKFYESKQ